MPKFYEKFTQYDHIYCEYKNCVVLECVEWLEFIRFQYCNNIIRREKNINIHRFIRVYRVHCTVYCIHWNKTVFWILNQWNFLLVFAVYRAVSCLTLTVHDCFGWHWLAYRLYSIHIHRLSYRKRLFLFQRKYLFLNYQSRLAFYLFLFLIFVCVDSLKLLFWLDNFDLIWFCLSYSSGSWIFQLFSLSVCFSFFKPKSALFDVSFNVFIIIFIKFSFSLSTLKIYTNRVNYRR